MTSTARPDATAPYSAAPFDPTTVNLHDPAYTADPYATYARFRASAPISHVGAPYTSQWVFRHADVVAALEDKATFVKNPPGGSPRAPGIFGVMGSLPPGVFSADPPLHTAVRAAFEPPLRAAFAKAPEIANGLVDAFLAELKQSGAQSFDVMAAYAVDIPSGTLFSLLGIPPTHWPQLRQMVSAIAAMNDITGSPVARGGGMTQLMALYFYCQMLVREAAESAENTTLRQMYAAGMAGALGPEALQSTLLNLLVAGYVSTTYLIGTGLRNLLGNPDQLALLRADESLRKGAVEEMLRYDAPAQVVDRVVAADTVLGGVSLAKGDVVTLVLGSANRDESVFTDPDRFDITRPIDYRAVPFGGGIHVCIGYPLVGHVAPIAIGRLVSELPNLALAGEPQWQTDPYLRGPTSLTLSF